MGTTAPRPADRYQAGPVTDPAARVPVAALARTSTLYMQDPEASLRRQIREIEGKLLPGWFIAAYYWDIESGGLDIEARGHGTAHENFPGIPRDGGLADLLAEAATPAPKFAAVMCEDIERSGRDTFNALRLERQLSDAGIPLFATDEPIDIAGANATTVLVRRTKQGVAEWFRLQIKEKAWKGLREHSLAGWNIGSAPYGYAAERVPHSSPFKAQQGRTKTRLVLDPVRAPVAGQIFAWRTRDRLGVPTITGRLAADTGHYPPPDPELGWTEAGVRSILRNPKYTGHMVFGRTRKAGGKRGLPVPAEEWLWPAWSQMPRPKNTLVGR
jgi:site-specific DNA recombinase